MGYGDEIVFKACMSESRWLINSKCSSEPIENSCRSHVVGMVVKHLHVLVPMRCPRVVPTDVVYNYIRTSSISPRRCPWPHWSVGKLGLATCVIDRFCTFLCCQY